MWRTAKQLFKEFWLPLIIGLAWTSYVVGAYGKLTAYISNFATSFFLASWLTGQFNRIRRDHKVKDSFDSLETRLAALGISLEEALSRFMYNGDKPRNSPAAVTPVPTENLSVVADQNSKLPVSKDEEGSADVATNVIDLGAYRTERMRRDVIHDPNALVAA